MPQRSGYIALVSALIISAVVFLVVFALGQASFFGRAGVADAVYKEQARALAEACVNVALLGLSEDDNYAGDETIAVGGDYCEILPVENASSGRIIYAQGMFGGAYTNFKVTLATATVDIIKWEEVRSF